MQRAFSLVELSMVLVILGLLTGGVLGGQALIKASSQRAVITEYNRWVTATTAFNEKYNALPGDFNDATGYWGAAHATPTTCLTTVGTGTQTCNGDGDLLIDYPASGNQYGEVFTFWQHLSSAGMIDGSYSGRSGGTAASTANAGNVPASKLQSGYWYMYNLQTNGITGDPSLYDGNYNDNMLRIGALVAVGPPSTALFKAEEVWNIDRKLDDGRPASGIMRTFSRSTCTDSTSSSDYDSDYLLSLTTVSCNPYFLMK